MDSVNDDGDDEVMEAIKTIKKHIDFLQFSVKDLEKQVVTLEDKIETLEDEIKSLEDENQDLTIENSDLEQQLSYDDGDNLSNYDTDELLDAIFYRNDAKSTIVDNKDLDFLLDGVLDGTILFTNDAIRFKMKKFLEDYLQRSINV